MSLRARLVAVVVVLNLAVVGVMQLGSVWVQRRQLAVQQEFFLRVLQTVLEEFYPAAASAREHRWVRDVLRQDTFRRVFRDVMISSGAAAGAQGVVDLNPMGAAHRATGFSTEAVHRGILRAKAEQRPVAVGPGFCVPIETGGEVDVGAWYVPAVQQPAPMPLGWFALPVLLSTVLIAVLAYFGLGRSVVRPLDEVGRAAARLGAGEADVRVGHAGSPELNVLVDAFNAMAAKVAGHTEELRREVAKATEEAARKERALVVSSRLAAVGTLAAGIAHEINNPIAGMMNAAHRLLQRDGLDERARVYLTVILEGLERVGAITRRVLDFSPRQLAAAPFRLAAAVDGARQLVEHRCKTEGVELRTQIQDDLEVVGDHNELQQVFLNFFLNSLDVLHDRPGPRWIEVRAERTGDRIAVAVDDNGPGADAATLARVFDPFFSAKGSPTASGLGLFISYSIIKNHGGEMEVDAAPGKGFHVRLRLPFREPVPDRAG